MTTELRSDKEQEAQVRLQQQLFRTLLSGGGLAAVGALDVGGVSEKNTGSVPEMWHPHVYGRRPKSPTPFSIDDILRGSTNKKGEEGDKQQQQQQHQEAVEKLQRSLLEFQANALAVSLGLVGGGGGGGNGGGVAGANLAGLAVAAAAANGHSVGSVDSSAGGSPPRMPTPPADEDASAEDKCENAVERSGRGEDQPLNLTTKKELGNVDSRGEKDLLTEKDFELTQTLTF